MQNVFFSSATLNFVHLKNQSSIAERDVMLCVGFLYDDSPLLRMSVLKSYINIARLALHLLVVVYSFLCGVRATMYKPRIWLSRVTSSDNPNQSYNYIC